MLVISWFNISGFPLFLTMFSSVQSIMRLSQVPPKICRSCIQHVIRDGRLRQNLDAVQQMRTFASSSVSLSMKWKIEFEAELVWCLRLESHFPQNITTIALYWLLIGSGMKYFWFLKVSILTCTCQCLLEIGGYTCHNFIRHVSRNMSATFFSLMSKAGYFKFPIFTSGKCILN